MVERKRQEDSMKRARTKPLHLVLRIKGRINAWGRRYDVIEEHNRVFNTKGAVALGKVGRIVCAERRKILKTQIKEGIKTYLYIAAIGQDNYAGYRAPLKDVLEIGGRFIGVPYPTYYNEAEIYPSAWFVLSGPFKPASLDALKLASNQQPVVKTLRKCRTVLMFVTA